MRFSPLFAVGLAIAVAVVAGWAGSVQADTLRSLSSCTADCAEQRKALWQQAEDLESQGQYETAAQRYNGVIALAPLSLKAQHAAMRAARCMEQAGDLSQAITFYDQVINIADTRANQEPGTRRLRDYKKEALFSKPHACRQAGMVQQARQTIEQLKAKFPSSSRCVQIGILEAELDGRDTEPAQQLFARDTEAVGLWTQGMHAMGRAEYAQALTLFERVITDYPDTSAALRALENKGRVLLKHKRFSEAGQTFSTLLRNRLGESTRHSRFYRDMRLLLRKALLEELIRKRRSGQRPSEQQFNELGDLCQEIIAEDTWLFGRVYGHLTLAEMYTWKGDYARALEAGQELIRVYQQGDKEDWKQFKAQIAWGHLYAGAALHKLSQYDAALSHYRHIVDFIYDYPPYGAGSETREHAYYRIWQTLRRAGAPPKEVAQAAEAFLSRFPKSRFAARVRRTLD